MVEKTKRHKKGLISEEDISALLHRYTATTVLALLQEVAAFGLPDVKIDWNALVKKTSTGISNAREYQMLWRHLAYRDALLEKLEDGAGPLDDDSDLEYELEAFPAVSTEASTEAAACVKVLIASGLPSDSSLPNSSTVEAALTINIPNGQSSRAPSENSQPACSMQGTNITVPVSVLKLPMPTVTSAEGFDANGSASGSLPARKKRKPWSEAEDMELIAAVRKCGEGNWANILKGDFKGDRTASQLSQRWAIIRKRQGSNLNVGRANSTGSQLSEAQLAARRAVSLALNMPMVKNLTAACSIGTGTSGTNPNTTSGNSALPTAAEALPVGSSVPRAQHQFQQGSIPTTSRTGSLGSVPKSRITSKKTSTKSTFSPNSMVKAAAVAAGARIATPADAASVLKAAQSKNAVHIMAGGGSLIKSSIPGSANPLPATHLGAHSNVHFICTGLAATPLSTNPPITPSASRPGSVKPAAPTAELTPSTTATSLDMSSEQTNAATPMAIELPLKQEVKTVEEMEVSGSGNAPKGQVQEDQACVSGNAPNEQVREDQAALSNPEAVPKNQTAVVENPKCSSDMETAENNRTTIVGNQAGETQSVNDNNMMDLPVKEGGENQSTVGDDCENQSANREQEDLTSMVMDGTGEKLEVLGEALAGTEILGENNKD